MKRYFIPVFAAASLIFAAAWTYSARPTRAASLPPAPPPESTAASVVAAQGLVEPQSENIAISTAVPGLITKVYVKAGDRVLQGQPLFSLDDRDLAANLEMKRSALATAQARLARLEQSPRPEDIPPAQAKVAEAKALLADADVQVRLIESVTDRRAVREEDVQRRRLNREAAKARVEEAEKELALIQAGTWKPDIEIARSEVSQAEAAVRFDEVSIERMTVRAPAHGVILQSKARPGQYAQAGPMEEPLMVFGAGTGFNVRADIDESEAWRVQKGAHALAHPRGNSKVSYALEFVRFEPYVVPKKSLTGDATERVDTRVMQVIYRISDRHAPVRDGQQMDIFINEEVSQ